MVSAKGEFIGTADEMIRKMQIRKLVAMKDIVTGADQRIESLRFEKQDTKLSWKDTDLINYMLISIKKAKESEEAERIKKEEEQLTRPDSNEELSTHRNVDDQSISDTISLPDVHTLTGMSSDRKRFQLSLGEIPELTVDPYEQLDLNVF